MLWKDSKVLWGVQAVAMSVWQEERQVQEPPFEGAQSEILAYMEHQKTQGQSAGLGAVG